MPIQKQHKEFHLIEMGGEGWRAPPGYPPEIEQKILAGILDEASKTGSRTRLLRFRPGAHTTEPFVHDYWEEVYPGELTVLDAQFSEGVRSFGKHTYACRPPGVLHGPFRSEKGCLLLEFHYYDRSS
jgi:ChrR Cupin-like domain